MHSNTIHDIQKHFYIILFTLMSLNMPIEIHAKCLHSTYFEVVKPLLTQFFNDTPLVSFHQFLAALTYIHYRVNDESVNFISHFSISDATRRKKFPPCIPIRFMTPKKSIYFTTPICLNNNIYPMSKIVKLKNCVSFLQKLPSR